MALQPTHAEPLSATHGSVVSSYPGQLLVLAFRWAVTTSWFLFVLAAFLVSSSLLISFYTDAWHWFQRSGALMVSIGAVLSTRRALGMILESMIGDASTQVRSDTSKFLSDKGELQACVCGFALVAMGTLVWAYGDLLGCLLHWNSSCLI